MTRRLPQLPPPVPLAQRTAHTRERLAQYVRIDLRGAHVGVPEQGLHRTDIAAATQQLGGKGMPKAVAAGRLAQAAGPHRLLDRPLDRCDMDMVADGIAVRGPGIRRRREHPLPW